MGITGIHGINAIYPFVGPARITTSIISIRKDFMRSLVPLHKFGGWSLRNNVIRASTFNFSLGGRSPENEKELRNCSGEFRRMMSLISSAVTFLGGIIALSHRH